MKTTSLILKLTFVAVILFAVSSAKAQESQKNDDKNRMPPPTVEQIFKMFDQNKDGKLAKSEVKGPLLNDFAKIDTNKDGFISKVEIEKAPKPSGPPPTKEN